MDIEPDTELLLGKKVPILFNKLNDSAIDNSGESTPISALAQFLRQQNKYSAPRFLKNKFNYIK